MHAFDAEAMAWEATAWRRTACEDHDVDMAVRLTTGGPGAGRPFAIERSIDALAPITKRLSGLYGSSPGRVRSTCFQPTAWSTVFHAAQPSMPPLGTFEQPMFDATRQR